MKLGWNDAATFACALLPFMSRACETETGVPAPNGELTIPVPRDLVRNTQAVPHVPWNAVLQDSHFVLLTFRFRENFTRFSKRFEWP